MATWFGRLFGQLSRRGRFCLKVSPETRELVDQWIVKAHGFALACLAGTA